MFLRVEADKTPLLLSQSFNFSFLYTKINLADQKAYMKVLINGVFWSYVLTSCWFKEQLFISGICGFGWNKRSSLFSLFIVSRLWKLQNQAHGLSFWQIICFFLLVIVLINKSIDILMGTKRAVYLTNLYLFSYMSLIFQSVFWDATPTLFCSRGYL